MRIPGTIDLSVYGDPELSAVLARGQYRECSDSELKAGLVELEKLIGPKLAKAPGWLRRLVFVKSTKNIGCVVTHVRQAMYPDAPWVDSDDTHPVPLALPLASAVALLASEKNPEIEWQRRQRLCDEFDAAQEAKQKENRARQEAEAAENRRANKERADFKADAWEKTLTDPIRFVLKLAVLVEKRDPALAADVRSLVAEMDAHAKAIARGQPGLDFPRAKWWTDAVDSGEKAA
jgi:hypothetical protein